MAFLWYGLAVVFLVAAMGVDYDFIARYPGVDPKLFNAVFVWIAVTFLIVARYFPEQRWLRRKIAARLPRFWTPPPPTNPAAPSGPPKASRPSANGPAQKRQPVITRPGFWGW